MREEELPQQAEGRELLPPRRGRRTWLMILMCGVILVCGIAIGSGVTLWVLQHRGLRAFRHPEKTPEAIMERLRSKLDLTDEQARRVEEILREHQKSLHAIRREVHPRFMAEFDKLRNEVSEVLTPEQAKKWVVHFESRRPRWLLAPPPGPPGRGVPRAPRPPDSSEPSTDQ